MKYFKVIIFNLLILTTINAQQVLDKVVAVIDNEIILKSELDVRVSYMAGRAGKKQNDPVLRQSVLQQMIDEKLLYVQAELDTIEVREEQIDQQLDNQMNYFISQYGSKERVEEVYGMSIEKIKREFREDVKKDIMAQTVQQKKFSGIEISRREVVDFFENYKDSLGLIPEKLTISHIFIDPQKSDRLKAKALEFAKTILDSIKKGEDFGELAKKVSDDPGSAATGGELGWAQRGVFFPEFEAAAFALEKNQISGITESPVGFHIIQLLDRRGEAINTRHILIKIKSDDEADIKAIELLTELRDSIKNGKSFEELAKKFSDNKETAKFGGKLGTFEIGKLDQQLRDVAYKLNIGEISFPKRIDVSRISYGFHIVKLDNRVKQHKPEVETDFDDLKELALLRKKQKLYSEWLEEIKTKIFWEIRE